MNIHHFFLAENGAASLRYRALIPGAVILDRGHRITATTCWDMEDDVDVLVLHKHLFPEPVANMVRQAKERGLTVVYDLCDDHFNDPVKAAACRAMAGVADVITVPTEGMQNSVRDNLLRDSVVIEDPYEFEERPPSFAPEDPASPLLMWYGHVNNIRALLNVWPSLAGCRACLITDPERVKDLPLPIVPWSLDNMRRGFAIADMVILPVDLSRPRKQNKSTNRMVEAIRQGKFVAASPLPAYQQFGEWMWLGDIRAGVDWAFSHPDEVVERIARAQDYVRDRFSPETIAEKWLEVFHEN